EVQVAISQIYRQEGLPQCSLAMLQALSASFPPGQTPTDVLVQEGFALGALGRHQEAAHTLAQACRQCGGPSAALLYVLAQSQMLAGESDAARQTCVAALERVPNHAGCQALHQQWGTQERTIVAASHAALPTHLAPASQSLP